MARFKRSEYNSILKEDSPYQDGDDNIPTPLFMDSNKGLVMWSGEGDIPEVGDHVSMRIPVSYTGIVVSHFQEYGYVGLRVRPNHEYHDALSQQGYGKLPKVGEDWGEGDLVYNYGCDLTTDS